MDDIETLAKFEYLPNEILLKCFEYLNAFDIFYSFDELNNRINNLIYNIPLYIHFQDVNKSVFDYFCKKLSLNPKLKEQIYSLKLSSKSESFQTKIFLSLFSFDQFSNLRQVKAIFPLAGCEFLPLHENDVGSYYKVNLTDLLFSKLQTLSVETLMLPFRLNIEKTSLIINLTISKCCLNKLIQLLKYLPILKYLNIHYVKDETRLDSPYIYNSALHLKQLIIGESDFRMKYLPKLSILKVTINYGCKLKEFYSRFENEAKKLNLIFYKEDIYKKYMDDEMESPNIYLHEIKLFIWFDKKI